MGDELIQALADVHAGLYRSTVEKVRSLAKEAIPAFEYDTASRAKILQKLETLLSKLDKEPD